MAGSNPAYVNAAFTTNPIQPIAAGKTGTPEVLPGGGDFAVGTVTFADNPTALDTITLAGIVVEFTAAASDATAAGTVADPVLVNIKGSLALTLDEILVVCNGAVPAAAAAATYTEDGATILTITHDTLGAAGNAFTLAASADTVSAATLTGGLDTPVLSMLTATHDLALSQAANQAFTLEDGLDGQQKALVMSAIGAGSAVVTGTFDGGTTLTFDAVNEYAEMRWLAGKWRLIANTSTLA